MVITASNIATLFNLFQTYVLTKYINYEASYLSCGVLCVLGIVCTLFVKGTLYDKAKENYESRFGRHI